MDFSLSTIVLWAVPVVFAITLHEAAHGYVARIFGDQTAWMLGRVTLNPIKHIDPIGTIVVPLITSLAGFVFGWAKPVPVNFNNLRNPKRDMFWVAAAGPASNVIQALIWALVAKMLFDVDGGVATYWVQVAEAGILVNLILAILNLFPILPLDGGRMLTSILPDPLAYRFAQLERYGMVILIGFIVMLALFPPARQLFGAIMASANHLIYSLFGLDQ